MTVRTFADGASGGEKGKTASSSSSSSAPPEDDMTNELVLTPGEKVVAATRLTMWAGIAAFAAVCAYYIGKELLPTYVSFAANLPRALSSRASQPLIFADLLLPVFVHAKRLICSARRSKMSPNQDVKHRFGEPLKGYGRDHGGHREGRRNFIEHTEYKSEEDGSKRTRVRYNLEGRHGKAFVFAEVSSEMPAGEFVYILVQDKSNGRVFTVVDNRAALTAARLSSGSKEAQSAMAQLLSGSGERK
jgi:mitochondrial import inner membrane translocase subunit TIM21